MGIMDRVAKAHAVLVRVEERAETCRKDIAWYEARRKAVIDAASTIEFAEDSARFYDGMIAEQRGLLAVLELILEDDPRWQVTSDEYADLAAGDHFVGVGQ